MSWLSAALETIAAAEPAVLVTVAEAKGSTPREAGAKMLVRHGDIVGSIGGGQLELLAIDTARRLMAEGAAHPELMRYSLGPDLGQCCGGAVRLLLEPLSGADHGWLAEWQKRASEEETATLVTMRDGTKTWTAIDSPSPLVGEGCEGLANEVSLAEAGWGVRRREARDRERDVLQSSGAASPPIPTFPHKGGRRSSEPFARMAEEAGAAWQVVETVRRRARPVWLFGAGHVGRALAKVLVELPFEVTWLDSRFDGFPEEIPAGIRHVTAPQLAAKVDEAPRATLFLVMTHSHQLDLEICDRVLRRGDFAFLGLIGSETKKARFLNALKGFGHGAGALERLVCPIGLAQIPGKQPMAIAVSTAAQLLALPAAEAANSESGQSTGDRRGAG